MPAACDARRRLALDHLACRAYALAPPPPHLPRRAAGGRRPGRPLAHHACSPTASCGSSGPTTAPSRTGPRPSRSTAPCPCRSSRSSTARAALEIVTDRLQLIYDRGPFSPPGSASRRAATSATTTASGATASRTHDLGGTARTLDDVDGRVAAGARHRLGRAASPRSTTRARSLLDRRRLGRAARRRRHRPLRLRLRPRLPGGARAFYAVSGPPPRAAALRARQLVEPLPPLQRRQYLG